MPLTDSQKVVRNDTGIRAAVALEGIATALGGLGADNAKKADLTSIIATGTTNATGATIAKGTYFYLNGTLVQAKADIASNATFTSGTNYEAVTAGGLNDLKNSITAFDIKGKANSYWSSDLNNISDTSVWYCNNTSINKPDGQTWGIVYSWVYDTNTEFQLFISNSGTSIGTLFTRIKNANGWKNWVVYNSYNLITPIAASGISIVSGGYVRMGKTIVIDMRIKATADISADTAILTGVPYPVSDDDIIEISRWDGSTTGNKNNRVYGSSIYTGFALTNGSNYRVKGTYLTSDG